MASTARFIATSSRFSSLSTRQQALSRSRVLDDISTGFRNHTRPQLSGHSGQRYGVSAFHTQHATLARSRDGKHSPDASYLPQSSSFNRLWYGRYFTTALRNRDGAKQDGAQGGQSPNKQATETTKTAAGTNTEQPLAVPQVLQRLTPIAAKVTHENIYTLPNFLTTTRIITAPCITYALLHSQPVLAFTLFAYSSITDLVDGYLARRYNSHTVLGSILDPFADKLLMTLTTISLYTIGTFPWWLTLIILGRDAGLLLSALYFRWISLPPPRTMTRYWDFSLPSAEVRPTEISKINTLLQFLLVADAVLLPVLPVSLVESWNLWGVLEGWMGLVAGTTIWSGLSYLWTRDAIRFIGSDRDGPKKEEKQ